MGCLQSLPGPSMQGSSVATLPRSVRRGECDLAGTTTGRLLSTIEPRSSQQISATSASSWPPRFTGSETFLENYCLSSFLHMHIAHCTCRCENCSTKQWCSGECRLLDWSGGHKNNCNKGAEQRKVSLLVVCIRFLAMLCFLNPFLPRSQGLNRPR